MSPQLVSASHVAPTKSETSYKSPPSSSSDSSHHLGDTPRGRRQDRDRSVTARAEGDSGEEKDDDDGAGVSASGKPRKRKRSRKGLEKNFPCPHQGCGKSYSRAEHLYRHQLNHSPKKIYICDFPGCERQFVRQDLCTRHRERHTARGGTHLQRPLTKDSYLPNVDGTLSASSPISAHRDQSEHALPAPSSMQLSTNINSSRHIIDENSRAHESSFASTHMSVGGAAGPPHEPHPKGMGYLQSNGTPSQLYNKAESAADYGSVASLNKPSQIDQQPSNPQFANFDLSRHASHAPMSTPFQNQGQPRFGSPHSHGGHTSDTNQSGSAPRSHTGHDNYHPSSSSGYSTTPQIHAGPSRTQNEGMNGGYVSHQNFSPPAALPPPSFPSASHSSAKGSQSNFAGTQSPYSSVSASVVDMPSSNGLDPSIVDVNGNPYAMPVFGGDAYSRSPFAMADDFAEWLFSDPHLNTGSPGGYRQGSITTVGNTPFMDEFGGTSRNVFGASGGGSLNGQFGHVIPPQHPMAVNSILDTTLPQTLLSSEKRQELLDLITLRFNDTDQAPLKRQKETLLKEDREDENHVLSLRSLQTYIGSYWYHFHPQLPILHKPTFSPDKNENLLLIGVISIGASCLDEKYHGEEFTKSAAELSHFLAWHLRGEIFRHADFTPPAKLWVFQTLLLLEIFEKMYATRKLHERAHIHHGTTLTLMRRGTFLIGRSPLDSPPLVKDEKPGVSGNTADHGPMINTPEQWWNHWITNEATRRVAFAAFIMDSIHATMFGHSATMVAHEMKLQLPCDESLWSATSSLEVGRIEANLQANGVKPISFYDGLKNTLKNRPVRTNAFGRTALMAGLLSVSWHMNQRDVQVRTLGATLNALGGKDIWRGPLTKAFEFWKINFDQSVEKDQGSATPLYQTQGRLDEENIFESRTVLHHLANMAMHVDIVSCQIFAKAERLLGRTTLPADYTVAQKRIKDNWAPRPSARHATFYALKFLRQVLVPDLNTSHQSQNTYTSPDFTGYSARNDPLLNRPWVLYFAALVVWSYGYALDGPVRQVPNVTTEEQQAHDMRRFLDRVGGVRAPDDLDFIPDRNACIGMLCILRAMFIKCRWELVHEAAKLLTNCIDMLKGHAV